MKGTSKVIMGATLVMVVSLAIVLGLVFVLLAELYCTLLLRRRQLSCTSSDTTSPATVAATTATSTTPNTPPSEPPQNENQSPSSLPLIACYAQGVLQAPRSFLFPTVPCKEDKVTDKKNRPTLESKTSPQHIGLVSTNSAPPTAFELPIQIGRRSACNDKACGGGSGAGGEGGEHFVYISNPIYDNDGGRPSRAVDTPFQTPDSSPSRLETVDSSSDEEVGQPSASSQHSSPATPPLTPMKKLPAEACSVSLRDARSLGTSGSDSLSNNGISSSSSGSPCTSPSW